MKFVLKSSVFALAMTFLVSSLAVAESHHERIARKSHALAEACAELHIIVDEHNGYHHLKGNILRLEQHARQLSHAARSGQPMGDLRVRFDSMHEHFRILSEQVRIAHEMHRHMRIGAAWERVRILFHELREEF